jgi:L-2,4-diaminobutyrate decarboxylase
MTLPPVPTSISGAYDVSAFRNNGHRLIDMLADALSASQSRLPAVLPWRSPIDNMPTWALTEQDMAGGGDAVARMGEVIAASTKLHHPGYAGHQVAPPVPMAALAELVSAYLNQGMGVYEMGPAGVPMELSVIRWMCQKLALPSTAGGVLTSGGTIGNLTALLAIRQLTAGHDVWRQGAHAGPPLAIITSTQSHYSVARALKIMGWGDAGAIAAPVNAQFRLTGAAVQAAIDQAKQQGRKVVAIVACAGSTSTGACDELAEIADVAQAHQLWFHVDGAHGASLALSADSAHRALVGGIERADSVVWDAHKMLMMPALVTAVLFRQESHGYAAFAQQAAYLFASGSPADTWWDLGQRTMECTKRMMALELYATLVAHGESMFADVVARQCHVAARFAQLVQQSPDVELAVQPDINIVCYRFDPPGVALAPEQLDALQQTIRQRIIASGQHYIVSTRLPTGTYLRSAFMNPMTTEEDLQALLHNVRLRR